MSTYALLGATGATGTSILHHLLQNPPQDLIQLNILVRSKPKLLQTFPTLLSSRPPPPFKIHIFEGTSTSPHSLTPCLTSATTILNCVGTNASNPGTTLHSATASAIISSLTTISLTNKSHYQPPTILQLRTASLNPALSSQVPKLVHSVVSFCLHNSYSDLEEACNLYIPASRNGLLNYILIDPPTLHESPPTGYSLITRADEKQDVALSYADLGAAMCELATTRERLHGKAVGVTARGKVREKWMPLMGFLVKGAMGRVGERLREGVTFLYGPMAPFFAIVCDSRDDDDDDDECFGGAGSGMLVLEWLAEEWGRV
ncbi:hypothetical protein QC764_207420 [Podospora pseudoanserina]|uniref:NAD(P)-binding domain-containing protein n=1 Tax=Podospora pseudoanserina TaxID=2609844 RepID=A0ABR0IHD9_9PEZI|nr:hypothetical protein QC764_207420 [Podospora pseudoanserina]